MGVKKVNTQERSSNYGKTILTLPTPLCFHGAARTHAAVHFIPPQKSFLHFTAPPATPSTKLQPPKYEQTKPSRISFHHFFFSARTFICRQKQQHALLTIAHLPFANGGNKTRLLPLSPLSSWRNNSKLVASEPGRIWRDRGADQKRGRGRARERECLSLEI